MVVTFSATPRTTKPKFNRASSVLTAAQAACLVVCLVEAAGAEQERDDRDKPAAGHER